MFIIGMAKSHKYLSVLPFSGPGEQETPPIWQQALKSDFLGAFCVSNAEAHK
jgi:hypothetical protein